MQEKASTAQYKNQDSEIRSSEIKATRIQVGKIKREEIQRDLLRYKPEGVARLLFGRFYGMET